MVIEMLAKKDLLRYGRRLGYACLILLLLGTSSCSTDPASTAVDPQFVGRVDSPEAVEALKTTEDLLEVTPEKAALHPDYQIVENLAVPFAPEYRVGPADVIEIIYHINYENAQDAYRLEIQDKISIAFPYHSQFSSTVLVRTDGKITVPILGDVQAASLTPAQLAANLNREYGKIMEQPGVTVALEDFNVKIKELKRAITTAPRGQSKIAPVAPDGRVAFPIIGNLQAEGLTLAQLESKVNQEYSKTIRNLNATLVLLEIHHNKFYVLGEVGRPGAYEMPSRINLIDALAMAEGYKKTAMLENVVVFRNDGLERPIAFKVDLKRAIKEGHMYSALLIRPADVVYVPKTKWDDINDLMDRVFTRGIYAVLPFQSVFSVNYDIRGTSR